MLRRIGLLYSILLTLVWSPTILTAQENFEVHGLKIEGLKTLSVDQVKLHMSTYATGGFRRSILGKEAFLYSDEILKSDLRKIVRYCQREGFLNAKAELQSLKADTESRSVRIVILVTEGDSVSIRDVSWRMADSLADRSSVFDSLYRSRLKSTHLKSGRRFRDAYVDHDRRMLVRAMENAGYPYCEVIPHLTVDEEALVVDIVWSVNPGPRCVFSSIDVTGHKHIDDRIIRKSLTLRTGDVYSRKALEESQRRIYGLSLFHVVTVTAQLTAARDSLVPVDIRIKEAPRLTTKFGVGYGREEKFRTFADSYYLGFLGGARRLNLFVKHSGLEPYRVSLKLIQPAFLTSATTLEINPFLLRQEEPGFTVNRYGGSVSLLHELSRHLYSSVTYSLERVDLDTASIADIPETDVELEDAYNKSSVLLGLTFDNSRPMFSPTGGFYAAAASKISGLGLGSDYHFKRLLLDFRRYQPVLGMVVAARIKGGGINSTDDHEFVPVEDRFYSGGSASVRGWARSELGPMADDGTPIGGKSLFEASTELRYPIYGILTGAVFTDFGNVWLDSYSYKLDDLRYSAGFGFRVRTPIGPVRLDVAWPVEDEEKTGQFHISVGEAF